MDRVETLATLVHKTQGRDTGNIGTQETDNTKQKQTKIKNKNKQRKKNNKNSQHNTEN